MVETAARELKEIRRLLLDPTPENFQQVTEKLQHIAASVQSLTAGNTHDSLPGQRRTFFLKLRNDITNIRTLMQAPLKFYEELQILRAAQFGSYERTGALKSLEPQPSSSTVIHL
jgi:hypothetical protein